MTAAAILALCAYIAFVAYRGTAPWLYRLAVLPLCACLGLWLYVQYLGHLGAPIQHLPTQRFLYVHHAVTDQGKTILLWADVPHVGNRLYAFPYTRADEKALQQAAAASKGGHPQQGTPSGKKGQPSMGGDADFGFSNGDRLFGRSIPKVSP